jgi:hypothetical protein
MNTDQQTRLQNLIDQLMYGAAADEVYEARHRIVNLVNEIIEEITT